MKCYIYFIINKINRLRYVGQTTNFSRRKAEHFLKLRENRHPNKKLQNSFNKYGEENFVIEKITYENLTKAELDEMEKYYIKKYDSFKNGFNLTMGGTGGDTKSKLDFEKYCFAYFGNTKYKGMTMKTGNALGVDSSCISAIVNKKSYDAFREIAENLSNEEKDRYIKEFEKYFQITEDKIPKGRTKPPKDEDILKILCVASTYGRGIEKTILEHFHLTKGFIFHFMNGKRYDLIEQYKNLTKEERQNIGKKFFEEWNLQQYSKCKIKEIYTDLIVKYSSAT